MEALAIFILVVGLYICIRARAEENSHRAKQVLSLAEHNAQLESEITRLRAEAEELKKEAVSGDPIWVIRLTKSKTRPDMIRVQAANDALAVKEAMKQKILYTDIVSVTRVY